MFKCHLLVMPPVEASFRNALSISVWFLCTPRGTDAFLVSFFLFVHNTYSTSNIFVIPVYSHHLLTVKTNLNCNPEKIVTVRLLGLTILKKKNTYSKKASLIQLALSVSITVTS